MIENLINYVFDKGSSTITFKILDFDKQELNKAILSKEKVKEALDKYKKNLAGNPFLHLYDKEKDRESDYYEYEYDYTDYWLGFLLDYEFTENSLNCTFRLFPKGRIYEMITCGRFCPSIEVSCVGSFDEDVEVTILGFAINDLDYLQRRRAAYERKIKNGQKPKRKYE